MRNVLFATAAVGALALAAPAAHANLEIQYSPLGAAIPPCSTLDPTAASQQQLLRSLTRSMLRPG